MILRRSLPDPRIPSALAVGVCQLCFLTDQVAHNWLEEILCTLDVQTVDKLPNLDSNALLPVDISVEIVSCSCA